MLTLVVATIGKLILTGACLATGFAIGKYLNEIAVKLARVIKRKIAEIAYAIFKAIVRYKYSLSNAQYTQFETEVVM